MKRALLILVALLVFAGTAYYRNESLHDSAFRRAEAIRDLCYNSQGYSLDNAGAIPDSVAHQCGQGFRDYSAGENGRYLSAGLAGLAAALVVLALGWLLLRRRGAPPPPPPA